jgi:dTDP-4-amino-4,6-dideoxygalactose transaminase
VILTEKRDELKKYLEQNGVETKIHYVKTLDATNLGNYPNAENICAKCLSLPIYPHLESKEVDYICDRIREFFNV